MQVEKKNNQKIAFSPASSSSSFDDYPRGCCWLRWGLGGREKCGWVTYFYGTDFPTHFTVSYTKKKKTYTRSRFFFFFAPREFHMCVISMTLKFRWHVPVPRPCVSTGGAFFLFPVKIGSAGWHLGIFSAIFPQHRVWHKKVCCGTHMRVW